MVCAPAEPPPKATADLSSVDGLPAKFSKTPWKIERGAPCLGEHNDEVFSELLGLSQEEINSLREEGVI